MQVFKVMYRGKETTVYSVKDTGYGAGAVRFLIWVGYWKWIAASQCKPMFAADL